MGTGASVDVETLEEFDALVAAGASQMRGWRIQDVDLRERTAQLTALRPGGAVLLGCDVSAVAEEHLRTGGALLFPDLPRLPFDPYRPGLYTPQELYAGPGATPYDETPDALIYAWSRQHATDAEHRMAAALHDYAIDEALDEELGDAGAVGIMGGHDIDRDAHDFGQAALTGHRLARAGLRVVTGGGPGAMEAANLGAYLCPYDEGVVDDAVEMLAAQPSFHPSVTAWVTAAFAVRQAWPDGGTSIGIPTWFYGHEPPNAFASSIAKYFQNSLREDTLLRRCNAGIVFLPGAAGTVQEVFQDACENYYADEATLTPMVLVGADYWTREVPAWPLLSRLAASRPMARAVHLVDTVDDAVALVTS